MNYLENWIISKNVKPWFNKTYKSCRKVEYKIEVLIPPNISDPLNLNATTDDADFAAKLISPMTKKRKVRHRKRPKKPLPVLDLAQVPGPVPADVSGDADVSELEEEDKDLGT